MVDPLPLDRFALSADRVRWRCPRRWLRGEVDRTLPAGLRGQEALVDGLDVLAAVAHRGGVHHVEVTTTDPVETASAIADLLRRRGREVTTLARPSELQLRGRGDARGQLSLASGEVVVVDAADLLAEPGSWSALREAMELGDVTRLPLETAPLPHPDLAEVSVVVVGTDASLTALREADKRVERLLYRRLERLSDLERSPAGVAVLVGVLRDYLESEELGAASEGAIAELIERSARRGRRQRLAVDLHRERQSLLEARLTRPEGALDRRHVRAALERISARRSPREQAHRVRIARGQLVIDTEGSRVGVVNGLMVYGQSRQAYAVPGRITARIGVGRQGLINVERESKYSGRSFDKGVFQLAGFLRSLFGQVSPLGLAATLTFEQSYGRVDGDSATLAEALALLSSLADLPVRQDIAVSGAINPRGEVLPVGSATLKAEGWFRCCADRGLTGSQGVMLPRASAEDLQVSDVVARAVADERFHVWVVDTVDQAVEVALGRSAGVRPKGGFTRGSVYARAGHRARHMSERLFPPRRPPAKKTAKKAAPEAGPEEPEAAKGE